MRDSVTVHMQARPEVIWPLVSDVVTNAKRFAAETFDAEWLDGATGPAVGVRFRGHVKRNGWGPVYWSVATIDACNPGREFAFTVALLGRPANRWRGRDRLKPVSRPRGGSGRRWGRRPWRSGRRGCPRAG